MGGLSFSPGRDNPPVGVPPTPLQRVNIGFRANWPAGGFPSLAPAGLLFAGSYGQLEALMPRWPFISSQMAVTLAPLKITVSAATRALTACLKVSLSA